MSTNEQLEKRLVDLEARVAILENQKSDSPLEVKSLPRKRMSLREFMNSLSMSSDVQRALAIGFYLEQHEQMGSFNAQDIKRGFSLAKEPSPKNINDTINKNIRKGYFMETDERKDGTKAWTLTNSGIESINEEVGQK